MDRCFMEGLLRLVRILTSIGLFALAAAIVFFTLELRQFREQLPMLLEKVDATAQRVDPIVAEVAELKTFIPQIIEQSAGYQALIPEVLERIDVINQQLPIIIDEVTTISQAIEPILAESDAWRGELPAVLKRVDDTNTTVRGTNQQIAKVVPQVPLILAESEALRVEIPEMIASADELVGKAEEAGKEASRGLVSGFVGGILTSPFNLIGKIGENTTERLGFKNADSLTETDREQYAKAMKKLMKAPKQDAKEQWSNRRSGNSGLITIKSIDKQGQAICYQLLSDFIIAEGEDAGEHQLTTETCEE
ncbi:hypothetical protein [Agarivorans sp. Toyoura001]|uniref:hypothetical protein n=1 Tax=unclassified Agarivorans TaxID=2636026 RepID=UPI0010DD1EEE|nr:hypothetical protein [Agarivorans sp. Toyoura001]GDY24801.1 hypothetical protein AHAT_06910 [Agarivorans sp. Toyoura001]